MPVVNVIRLHHPDNWPGYTPVSNTPHHLLLFMEEGACTYWVDGVRYAVERGDALFMAAGLDRHAERAWDAHIKYSVHWIGDDLIRHFPHLENRAVLFKSASLHAYLKRAYSEMHLLWAKKDMYYQALCESMLLEVAARLHQHQSSQTRSGKQARVVQQVRDYILEYYREPLSVEELAQLVGRNPSHLITSFKKHFGMTPIEYMHRTRIAKAEELLLTTGDNYEAVAAELGYCDAVYLNRMFKRITGMTLSAYRRPYVHKG